MIDMVYNIVIKERRMLEECITRNSSQKYNFKKSIIKTMNWNIEWKCIIQNYFANIICTSTSRKINKEERFDVVFQCDVEIKNNIPNRINHLLEKLENLNEKFQDAFLD